MPTSDLLHVFGYVVVPIVLFAASIIWWFARRHFVVLNREKLRLAREKNAVIQKLRQANKELDALRNGNDPELRIAQQRLDDLTQQLKEAGDSKLEFHRRTAAAEAEVTRLREMVRAAKNALTQLKNQREAAQQDAATKHEQLSNQQQAAEEQDRRIEQLIDENNQLRTDRDEKEAKFDTADIALKEMGTEVFELKKQIVQLGQQMDGAFDQSGRVWEKPVADNAPAFVPFSERGIPIISVINLKGGVGKTTLTANLGAMLGKQGKRVLLLDLDYQRSLSAMCCSYAEIQRLHESGRCLQHFLLHPQPDAAKLIDCMTPVKQATGCEIIATGESHHGVAETDSLEDAEMQLMAKWLVGGNSPDVRLHLRNALHAPRLRERFDVVLLDCPPRLSTACINAMAASDFALIPVLLDLTSAIAVPNSLRKLRRLRQSGLLANLDILGVLANNAKLRVGNLEKAQATVWDEMREPCKRAWEADVPFLQTVIKHSSDVGKAADRHERGKPTGTFAAFLDDLEPVFGQLVEEIEERIDHARQRVAAVPA